ncbi:hypothetical protein GX48_05598 [Paracoccidioides brasiliensis]|nr:hypothetical protein GX48_05598 [Paracoccidioides brasiliensis]
MSLLKPPMSPSIHCTRRTGWLLLLRDGRREIGSAVTKKFTKGEKIMGFNHGINRERPTTGSFAEHVITKGDLPFRVPESLPMDQAATMPVGLYTVGQGLYQGILRLA